ncbi:MAG TPA: glycosyltransferase family 2 protein [Candidatus Saccharimonadia bacterium]|nr:glycosyltransferase family 2 protein [Candidatus Saccharimonadia bacterium]
MADQPLISIVVPCYNEQANLRPFYDAMQRVIKPLPYAFEFVFVDDGSADKTKKVLASLARKDEAVRPVELVRNFGKEIAVTAGLHQARGDAAIILDADLQHPPELIPEFLDKWQRLSEVVVGVRLPTKHHTSWLKRLASKWFYRIMGAISDVAIVPNATDYRLLDRLVIDEFNRFTERNRMTRGLIDWLGFRHAYVYFEPAKRLNGAPAYSYRKLLRLAIQSFISLSLFPLKLAGYLGLIITIVSLPLGIFIYIEKYIMSDPMRLHITGTATLGVVLLFLVGIILVCLGLMALYVANIYGEVVNRPLYVVRRERRF